MVGMEVQVMVKMVVLEGKMMVEVVVVEVIITQVPLPVETLMI